MEALSSCCSVLRFSIRPKRRPLPLRSPSRLWLSSDSPPQPSHTPSSPSTPPPKRAGALSPPIAKRPSHKRRHARRHEAHLPSPSSSSPPLPSSPLPSSPLPSSPPPSSPLPLPSPPPPPAATPHSSTAASCPSEAHSPPPPNSLVQAVSLPSDAPPYPAAPPASAAALHSQPPPLASGGAPSLAPPAAPSPLNAAPPTSPKRPRPPATRCDRCDGPHASEACPHYKKSRGAHPDAQRGAGASLGSCKGQKVLLRRGRVVGQPGDGSCLFHSMRYGLVQQRGSGVPSAQALRVMLARWVESNGETKLAHTPLSLWVKWDSGLSLRQYSSRMSHSGWGGGIEMAACARVMRVNVWVYERRPHGFERISAFDAAGGAGAEQTVHVLYQGGCHYDALVPDKAEVAAVWAQCYGGRPAAAAAGRGAGGGGGGGGSGGGGGGGFRQGGGGAPPGGARVGWGGGRGKGHRWGWRW
ncbi:hypothetical protein AB1Y20_016255 [Prymnesium parvum]|uniref:Ubiquitin thioesterase OTU n=1 Tax=Prymnesium parvum TaxID=97485 RepID=A0AB34IFU1_PRYPA